MAQVCSHRAGRRGVRGLLCFRVRARVRSRLPRLAHGMHHWLVRQGDPPRVKLAAAERKLEQITHRQEAERETVEREIRKLEQKLEQLGKRHSRARKAAKAKLEEERDSYQAALADWEA